MKKKFKEKYKKGFALGAETLVALLIILATLVLIVVIILILRGKLWSSLNYLKNIFRFLEVIKL
jgi:hypothetical protein